MSQDDDAEFSYDMLDGLSDDDSINEDEEDDNDEGTQEDMSEEAVGGVVREIFAVAGKFAKEQGPNAQIDEEHVQKYAPQTPPLQKNFSLLNMMSTVAAFFQIII